MHKANMSILVSQRCVALNNNGLPCRNRTRRAHKCWQHLKRDEGLRIKTSDVPGAGLGLFATRQIRHRGHVVEYEGEDMTRKAVDARYPGPALYVYCKNNVQCRDARMTTSGPARFANDGIIRRRNNARMVPGTYNLRAKKSIAAGKEILWDYGPTYWQRPPDHTNKSRRGQRTNANRKIRPS